jgi:VanZ family protein
MGALGVDRPRPGGFGDAVLVLPGCVAASAAIEFAQLFFPPRVSSLNDIVAQAVGAGLGAAAWLAWGQRCTVWARRFWSDPGASGPAARVFPAYLAVLVLVHVVPLDLTISPADLYHKYQEGRVRLVPFAGWDASPLEVTRKCLLNVAFFLPGGLLLAWLPGRVWRDGRSWLHVWGLGVGLAGLVEALQLFVQSRFADTTDVVTGGVAVLAGWGIGLAHRLEPSVPGAPPPWGGGGSPHALGGTALRPLLLAGWLGVLAFLTWQPFDFTTDLAPARLGTLSLIPLADTLQGDYLLAFDNLVQKVTLFLPLGALLAPRHVPPGRGIGLLAVALVSLAVAAGLEAGQLFLPTRTPSLTDVLVETAGACLAFALTCRIRETARGWSRR